MPRTRRADDRFEGAVDQAQWVWPLAATARLGVSTNSVRTASRSSSPAACGSPVAGRRVFCVMPLAAAEVLPTVVAASAEVALMRNSGGLSTEFRAGLIDRR